MVSAALIQIYKECNVKLKRVEHLKGVDHFLVMMK